MTVEDIGLGPAAAAQEVARFLGLDVKGGETLRPALRNSSGPAVCLLFRRQDSSSVVRPKGQAFYSRLSIKRWQHAGRAFISRLPPHHQINHTSRAGAALC